jgi:hypothetical protein
MHTHIRRFMLVAVAVAALVGCTTTREMTFGPLSNGVPLVRLVVTEDRELIGQQCRGTATRQLLGCQIERPILLPEGTIRGVTIVRYVDALPSDVALEVEAHELCHAVVGLQNMRDICHDGNRGIVQSTLPPQGLKIIR